MGWFDIFDRKKQHERNAKVNMAKVDEMVAQITIRTRELMRIEAAAETIYDLYYRDGNKTEGQTRPTNEQWTAAWQQLGVALGRIGTAQNAKRV